MHHAGSISTKKESPQISLTLTPKTRYICATSAETRCLMTQQLQNCRHRSELTLDSSCFLWCENCHSESVQAMWAHAPKHQTCPATSNVGSPAQKPYTSLQHLHIVSPPQKAAVHILQLFDILNLNLVDPPERTFQTTCIRPSRVNEEQRCMVS